jgi:hypothetical protein
MTDEAVGVDILQLVFIATAPVLITIFGAMYATAAAEAAIQAKTPEEALSKFTWFVIIWLLIPVLKYAVASIAMRISMQSEVAKRLAPWILGVGFVASLVSIQLYNHFFSLLTEGFWREVTRFHYTAPIFLTYGIALLRSLID